MQGAYSEDPLLTALAPVLWETLLALCDGEKVAETAARRGVRPQSVRNRQAELRASLNARTNAQAVANAYHLGILRALAATAHSADPRRSASTHE